MVSLTMMEGCHLVPKSALQGGEGGGGEERALLPDDQPPVWQERHFHAKALHRRHNASSGVQIACAAYGCASEILSRSLRAVGLINRL